MDNRVSKIVGCIQIIIVFFRISQLDVMRWIMLLDFLEEIDIYGQKRPDVAFEG